MHRGFRHAPSRRQERFGDTFAGPLLFFLVLAVAGMPSPTQAQDSAEAGSATGTATGTATGSATGDAEDEVPFASVQRDPDGVAWTVMPIPNVIGPMMLSGVGFVGSPTSGELCHLSLQLTGGWVVWTSGIVATSRGRMARYFGTSLSLSAGVDASLRLDGAAAAHHLAFPARGLFSWSIGRVALLASASLGPRWDIGSPRVGGQLAGGLGFALLLPPVAIPVLLETLYNFEGDLGGTWGLRASLVWPVAF